MKTMWENIPCDHTVKKVEEDGWTDYIHSYDYGLFDFDEAARRFSRFSFDAEYALGKIKEGRFEAVGFTGGQYDQLLFKADRIGDKVHVTMNETKCVYKRIRSKMI